MARWLQYLIFGLVLIVIGFFAFGLKARGETQPSAGVAPDFTLTTFDGQKVALADLRGKVVVINFWASWCVPCRDEAPFLEKTWRQYKDRGVVFIGIDWVDPEPDAKAYLKEFDITYLNGPDLQSTISSYYKIRGVPETFFVGKDGKIQGNSLGPVGPNSGFMSERQFVQKLDQLLAQ